MSACRSVAGDTPLGDEAHEDADERIRCRLEWLPYSPLVRCEGGARHRKTIGEKLLLKSNQTPHVLHNQQALLPPWWPARAGARNRNAKNITSSRHPKKKAMRSSGSASPPRPARNQEQVAHTTGRLSPPPPQPAKKARRFLLSALEPAPRPFIWGADTRSAHRQHLRAPEHRGGEDPASQLLTSAGGQQLPRQDATKRRRARLKNYPTLDLLRHHLQPPSDRLFRRRGGQGGPVNGGRPSRRRERWEKRATLYVLTEVVQGLGSTRYLLTISGAFFTSLCFSAIYAQKE
jgi:hypothetical protein